MFFLNNIEVSDYADNKIEYIQNVFSLDNLVDLNYVCNDVNMLTRDISMFNGRVLEDMRFAQNFYWYSETEIPFASTPLPTFPMIKYTTLDYGQRKIIGRVKIQDNLYIVITFKVRYSDGFNVSETYMSLTDLNVDTIDFTVDGEHCTVIDSKSSGFIPSEFNAYYLMPCIFGLNGRKHLTLLGGVEFTGFGDFKWYTGLTFNTIVLDDMIREFGDFTSGDDSGEYSEPSGGGGLFDDSSDVIPIPPIPDISICDMGFVKCYKIETGALDTLMSELFPEADFPTFDDIEITKILKNLGETLYAGIVSMQNTNLMQYLLDAHVVPVNPSTSYNELIKVGYRQTNCQGELINSDYVDVDCGTLNLSEYYGSFIDYVGTTAKLFLPFVGFVPIQNELFQSGYLKVVYRFNIIDGSFTCYVLSSSSKSKLRDSVIGSYSGNCCVHVPFSATNYSSVVSGLVGGVSNGLNALSRGSISGVGSSATEIMSAKPSVMQGNGYNATSSFLSIRTPYMIIERQVASYSKTYSKEHAYPLNVVMKLSNCHGLTVCDNPRLNLECTEEEKEMIETLLKDGVIF